MEGYQAQNGGQRIPWLSVPEVVRAEVMEEAVHPVGPCPLGLEANGGAEVGDGQMMPTDRPIPRLGQAPTEVPRWVHPPDIQGR